MAMNKAEKAELERLQTELAFRWPTEAEPIRSVKSSSPWEVVRGWDINVYNRSISHRWTTSISQGSVFEGENIGPSQNGRALYATADEAWLALRWAFCRQCAEYLRAMDNWRAS